MEVCRAKCGLEVLDSRSCSLVAQELSNEVSRSQVQIRTRSKTCGGGCQKVLCVQQPCTGWGRLGKRSEGGRFKVHLAQSLGHSASRRTAVWMLCACGVCPNPGHPVHPRVLPRRAGGTIGARLHWQVC